MAISRPYVTNAYILNLLNRPPVTDMRPSLGSLVQRKTIDIGCYPYPYMVNSDNIPLDGRIVGDKKLETRPVPFWCSANSFADSFEDTTYDNGKLQWSGKTGYFQSTLAGNTAPPIPAYGYDGVLGVTFPFIRINTAFVGMDKTVPQEWINVRNAAMLALPDGISFGAGETLTIGNNILFQAWTGLTIAVLRTTSGGGGGGGITYAMQLMQNFTQQGGTYSPLLDRYNYRCLDQVFNSEKFSNIAIDPLAFWNGQGASYGIDGGMSGEAFLLNALTGGVNSGSYYVKSPGGQNDFFTQMILGGVSGGNTISGKQLAQNLYGILAEQPFLGSQDPVGGFVDTMALLLGTNQKITTLAGGGTASLRALNFQNPCSASFVYREDTELGRWGYEVEKIAVGTDVFIPISTDIGCNTNTFLDYLKGTTAAAQGIVHPASWMFWKGLYTDVGTISKYAEGFVHDFVGMTEDPDNTENMIPIYNKLEGIHDHLCYEYWKGVTLQNRVYYPLNPMSSKYYDANVKDKFNPNVSGAEQAKLFGLTLDKKYDTEFVDAFKGVGALTDEVSLRSLTVGSDPQIRLETSDSETELNAVNGIMFPYFIPLASFGMSGMGVAGKGELKISGEFDNFDGKWSQSAFLVDENSTINQLYEYYADGVSSDADFETLQSAPFTIDGINQTLQKPNMKLYSWNTLSKIRPFEYNTSNVVTSSFKYINNSNGADTLGNAFYIPPSASSTDDLMTLELDGSVVNIDALAFPPAALPISTTTGITWQPGLSPNPIGLDCGSFINVEED